MELFFTRYKCVFDRSEHVEVSKHKVAHSAAKTSHTRRPPPSTTSPAPRGIIVFGLFGCSATLLLDY